MRTDLILAGLLSTSLAAGLAPAFGAETQASAIFAKKCSSCHTFGKGDLVGPDLKGVTERHPRPWLMAWVRSSERLIRLGEPAAVSLFHKYKQQRMPDHDLSTEQIHALLNYLAVGGPEAEAAAQLRQASTATPQELELGKDLFYGWVALTDGGAPCAACHSVFEQRTTGSLGSDLTRAYSKYQDKGISSLLQRSCFPRVPSADGTRPVTTKESFAIKAFLRQTDLQDQAR